MPLTQSQIADEVAKCPEVVDFSTLIPPLPKLGRRLKIAAPCTGIDGCGTAFKAMGVNVDICCAYDLEPGYREYLLHHFQELGMLRSDYDLHLGPDEGDLLKMPLHRLLPYIDLICAGPPCPPWAGQGLKKSTNDARASVFLKILEWVVYCIKRCGLLACVLENVVGILAERGGREAVITTWVRHLTSICPEFEWTVSTLRLRDYLCPQTRVRVFLRGWRKILGANLEVLPAFGKSDIRSILGHFEPTRDQLCPNQAGHLDRAELHVIEEYRAGNLIGSDVVVVAVDRDEDGVYSCCFLKNELPTLTTKSGTLFILSVQDVVDNTPDSQREFLRHVLKESPEKVLLKRVL